MIKVESKIANYAINVPTKREELDVNALGKVLDNVIVAKHYCVVALVYADTLFGVINNKKEVVNVIPILAKISDEDASSTGGVIGNQLVIDRTSLERGYHLYLPNNVLSPSYLAKYIEADKDLRHKVTMGNYGAEQGHARGSKVYTVEYKVIPVNDIRAMIDNSVAVNNPFKVELSNSL